MRTEPFDLTDVTYIKRISVGNTDPSHMKTEDDIQAQMDEVNKCLSGTPKGKIIAQDKNFSIYNIGEHQVVLQSVTYHIGFKRKPTWAVE